MHIKRTNQFSPKSLSKPAPKKAEPKEEKEPLLDRFMDSVGTELMVGGALGVMSSVPLIGALPTAGTGYNELFNQSPYDRSSLFDIGAGLAFCTSAALNVAGSIHLFGGQPEKGAAMLLGGGLLSGTTMALAMDGGSLASRLGLQS